MGNPTGKGGFGDHPEHRGSGRPKDTFTPILVNKYSESSAVAALVEKLHEMALNGNMQAMAYIMDRFLGKPRQSVEVSGIELPKVVGFDPDDYDESITEDTDADTES